MSRFITDSNFISTQALHRPNNSYLAHGFTWKNHRYIRKEGDRYIYPEDLKKSAQNLVSNARQAGQKLVSNARQTARNVGQTVGKAIGTTQRASLRRAQSEHNKWINISRDYGAGNLAKDYTGGFANRKGYQQPSGYINKNINRSYDSLRRAQQEYDKTVLGHISRARKAIANIPSDVSYEVAIFLRSKVGVGGRQRVRNARDVYSKQWNTSALNPYNRSAGSRLDSALSDYRQAVRDYGRTFLGSCEKLLNTSYSHIQLKNYSNRDTYDK